MWRATTTRAAPTWPRSTDYREVPALEEALYIIYKSYEALGMTQLRDDARRVLETNYPQSAFVQRGGFKPKDDPWWKVW